MRRPSPPPSSRLHAVLAVWICAIVAITLVESRPQEVQARFGTDILTVTTGQSTTESFSRTGTYRLHRQDPPSSCDLCGSRVEHFDQGRVAQAHYTFDFFERNSVAPSSWADADPVEKRRLVIVAQPLIGRPVAVEIPPPEA